MQVMASQKQMEAKYKQAQATAVSGLQGQAQHGAAVVQQEPTLNLLLCLLACMHVSMHAAACREAEVWLTVHVGLGFRPDIISRLHVGMGKLVCCSDFKLVVFIQGQKMDGSKKVACRRLQLQCIT
jgi:hypothetical protein